MKFLIALLLSSSAVVFAASPSLGGLSYSVQPIAGYDTTYRNTPTPHQATRAIYGVRVIAGKDLLSLEGEYSKAGDTETYVAAPQTIQNNDELIKLGVRSTLHLGTYVFFTARVGSQLDNNTNDSTSNGVVTHKTSSTSNTYAGADLGVQFGSVFSLALGTTVVFLNPNDMSKNEFQNTVALNFSLHTK